MFLRTKYSAENTILRMGLYMMQFPKTSRHHIFTKEADILALLLIVHGVPLGKKKSVPKEVHLLYDATREDIGTFRVVKRNNHVETMFLVPQQMKRIFDFMDREYPSCADMLVQDIVRVEKLIGSKFTRVPEAVVPGDRER